MKQFILAHDLVFETDDMETHVEQFLREMRQGLSQTGSSLQMIPTYVGLHETLDYKEKVIVIDAGGTNLRIALVRFSPEGVAQTEYFQKYPMLGTQKELGAEAFYTELAAYLKPIINEAEHIGVCFSFPAEILPNRDAKILYFDKEVKITGAEGSIIGQSLCEAMKALGMPHNKSVVVINDTVASLLGAKADNKASTEYGSYVGFILGTGLNMCYHEQNSAIVKSPTLSVKPGGTIINMESGGYAFMPQSDIDKVFIQKTKEPDQQLMEKMSSGAYQGGLLLQYLQKAASEGVFSPACNEKLQQLQTLSGLDIDLFCDHPFKDSILAAVCVTEQDAQQVYLLIDAFFDKVAFMVAVSLAAVLCALGEAAQNPCRPVCISAEGTTFYKARLLRPKLDYYLTGFAKRKKGLYYQFVKAENATILGTAVAGLMGNGNL